MESKIIKNLLIVQTAVLFGGTIFAWSKLLPQMRDFWGLYGTLFHFADCAIPNPLTTACFYGSVAFVAALVWSTYLIGSPSERRMKYLRDFLVFCVGFAASVFLYEAADYYKLFAGDALPISCSPGVHPLQTPCFYGMLFFISAAVVARVIVSKMQKTIKPL